MPLNIGVDIIALDGGHLGKKALGGEFLAVDAEFIHSLLGKRLGILLVDDRETFWIAHAIYLAAQKFHTEGMNGADEVVDASAVHHPGNATFHLLGGLVGESEAQDIPGRQDKHSGEPARESCPNRHRPPRAPSLRRPPRRSAAAR